MGTGPLSSESSYKNYSKDYSEEDSQAAEGALGGRTIRKESAQPEPIVLPKGEEGSELTPVSAKNITITPPCSSGSELAISRLSQSLLGKVGEREQLSVAEKWLYDILSAPPKDLSDDERKESLTRNLGFLLDPSAVPFSDSTQLRGIKRTVNMKWAEAYPVCREMLKKQVSEYKAVIQESKQKARGVSKDGRNPLYELSEKIRTNGELAKSGISVTKAKGGCGGAFFCKTAHEKPELLAILKSVNGDVGTVDNLNGYQHPFLSSVVRPTANYESVQKEALAYDLSLEFGCSDTVPPTILILSELDLPHYFSDPKIKEILDLCPENVRAEIISRLGGLPDKQRLCCLQEAVKSPNELNSLILNWGKPGFEDKPFNQDSFEDAIFMARLLGETDGHADNFLTVEKEGQYFLKKVDSGFSFPMKNSSALNCLTALPNAKLPLSQRYRDKVLSADPEKLEALAKKYKLNDEEITAAKERIMFMKELVTKKPSISHREFELRLRMFSGVGFNLHWEEFMERGEKDTFKARKQFALGDYEPSELKAFKATNRAIHPASDSKESLRQTKTGGLTKTGRPWKGYGKKSRAKNHISLCRGHLEQIRLSLGEKPGKDVETKLGMLAALLLEDENHLSQIENELRRIVDESESDYRSHFDSQRFKLNHLLGSLGELENGLLKAQTAINEGSAPEEISHMLTALLASRGIAVEEDTVKQISDSEEVGTSSSPAQTSIGENRGTPPSEEVEKKEPEPGYEDAEY